MFPKYELPLFEGNYYGVGYQHAEWWIRYLRRRKCKGYHDFYRRLLTRCWKPRFKPLFRNTLEAYPEIIFEILGMTQALTDAGYKTSPLHVFANCLGETGHQGSQCTAFVAFNGQEIILAHNEEESEVSPLCIANVTITGKAKPVSFMAASYPFQLFGSAFGGVNRHFAFQGNSIGYAKHIKSIEATWGDRLPKTVFTRKWLEFESLGEVLTMCSQWLFSLPSHNYFITHEKAYSVAIRPLSKLMWRPLDQVTLNEVHSLHCHTNQFIKDNKTDSNWVWKYTSDRNESYERLGYVTACLMNQQSLDHRSAIKIISMIATHDKYIKKTSASFVVVSHPNIFSVQVAARFNGSCYSTNF